jgi:UDP-N-acetylmuramoyl-tripeptide--D-alanyl-D-alanine ligase
MHRTTFDNLLRATGGTAVRLGGRAAFDRVQTDSRQVRGGDLFWPLKGTRHDAHDFLAEAVSRGATACVVAKHRLADVPAELPAVVVDDTHAALSRFAAWHRCGWDGTVVGVTGSFGKTTTREMVHAVLSSRYTGTRSPQNYNNHFGVPLSLLEIERRHHFAVIEFGASARGEIARTAAVARPDVGVITGIGPAHLSSERGDGFGDVPGVIQAKSELVESLAETGLAILAGDDARLRRIACRVHCRAVFVGEGEANAVRATGVWQSNRQLDFSVDEARYRVPVAGRHHLTAALVAVAVGREFGLSPHEMREGLAAFEPVPGRCHVLSVGPWTVIDDTYNANPASTQAACRLLRDWQLRPPGRKHLVLGDMLELGDHAAAYHRQAGRQVGVSRVDHLLACGQFSGEVVAGAVDEGLHAAHACAAVDEVLEQLERSLGPGDVVLVKGSRSMRMERVVDRLRERVDCRATARRAA